MYFNIADEIYARKSPGGGKSPSDWFKDDLKVYIGRANRRKGKANYAEMVAKLKKSKSSVFSDEVKTKFGTIYTPEFVVDKTLDLAFKYLPEGSDPLALTWCDPAVGDGNFLINLYYRLMKCPSELGDKMDQIARSEYILTKCLFGIEILRNMVYACKIRLVIAHLDTIKKNKPLARGYCDIIEKVNIFHGNAIMVPEDVGKWKIDEPQEGGLLDEGIRNKCYSVVIGNPPYTHLRNLENRRYHSYPKQRDMAQVFVRWALDHGNVISYNLSDTFDKSSDGVKETKTLLSDKVNEILRGDELAEYSMGEGGNLPTMILAFQLTPTGKNYEPPRVDVNVEFNYTPLTTYFPGWGICPSAGNSNKNSIMNTFIYCEVDKGDYWIIAKRKIGSGSQGPFKLVQCSDIKTWGAKYLDAEIKCVNLSKINGVWLLGFLNTKVASQVIKQMCRQVYTETSQTNDAAWVTNLDATKFLNIPVPDFDYYKTNRPEQFNTYMKWIEENMRDKDKFLAGIDVEFEKLIKE